MQTLDRDSHEAALAYLRQDFRAFCSSALKIVDKDGRLVPLDLNFAQQFVLDKIERQRELTGRVRVIVLKARQEGISTLVAARMTWRLALSATKTGMVIADELGRAGKIFGIYERFVQHAPEGAFPRTLRAGHARELAWATGSSVSVDTARDENIGRGEAIQNLHLSELAAWQATEKLSAEAAFNAVTESVPRLHSEAYIESTAHGVGNLFHRLWEGAVQLENDWLPIFLPWWIDESYALYPEEVSRELRAEITGSEDPFERMAMDQGIAWPSEVGGDGTVHKLSAEQLAWRRAKIREKGERLHDCLGFTQENPATHEEAFLVSGSAFFDAPTLAVYRKKAKAPILRGSFVKASGGLVFAEQTRGWVRIWERPDPLGHYVIAGDTAEGKLPRGIRTGSALQESAGERGGRDYNSAHVLKVAQSRRDQLGKLQRTACLRVVAVIHGHMAPEVFAEQVNAAAAYWACEGKRQELTGIERNHSSGQTVLKWLDEHGHQNLFVHERQNVIGPGFTTYLGWVTDGTTRMPMLDELARVFREGEIECFDDDTLREMRTFVRGAKGKPEAEEGCHDDRVMGLGIAVALRQHHRFGASGTVPVKERADTPTGV